MLYKARWVNLFSVEIPGPNRQRGEMVATVLQRAGDNVNNAFS